MNNMNNMNYILTMEGLIDSLICDVKTLETHKHSKYQKFSAVADEIIRLNEKIKQAKLHIVQKYNQARL